MSIDANEYARLCADSYEDHSKWVGSNESLALKGSELRYKVLAVANDPKTGYQGAAYQRVDTGEIVIAHRGTEPNGKDAGTDAGMVFNRRNNQLNEAIEFTKRVMALAKQEAEKKEQPLSVSVTGHSLGGTLAEITAAKYGMHAETFNAYGPGALKNLGGYGVNVHAPHPNIVNHVRATDVVAAGGPHLGQVKIYAAPQDIESLRHGRYVGASPLPGNPLLAADISAHSITNFLPGNKTLGESVMNPANEARARAYADPIAQYRHDVMQGRIDLYTVAHSVLPPTTAMSSVRLGVQTADAIGTVAVRKAGQTVASGVQTVGQGAKVIGNAAGQAYDATRDAVEAGARRTGEALERTGEAVREGASRILDKVNHPGSWFGSQADPTPLLSAPDHAGNGLFKQAQTGMQAIDARFGRASDLQTDNAAGFMAVRAHGAGLTRIDVMDLNDNGEKIIAVQGQPGTAQSKVVDVPTVLALNTPLAESSQAFVDAQRSRLAANQSNLQQATPDPTQQQAAPVLS